MYCTDDRKVSAAPATNDARQDLPHDGLEGRQWPPLGYGVANAHVSTKE